MAEELKGGHMVFALHEHLKDKIEEINYAVKQDLSKDAAKEAEGGNA